MGLVEQLTPPNDNSFFTVQNVHFSSKSFNFQTSINNAGLCTRAWCYCRSESILDGIICR